jgi:hypothetical protein
MFIALTREVPVNARNGHGECDGKQFGESEHRTGIFGVIGCGNNGGMWVVSIVEWQFRVDLFGLKIEGNKTKPEQGALFILCYL